MRCTTSGACYLSLGSDQEALDCLQQALSQSPGDRQPAPAGLHAEIPRPGTAPRRPGGRGSRVVDSGAAIFDELGDRAQAAEIRAEQAVSRHFMRSPIRAAQRPIRCCASASFCLSGGNQVNERTAMGNTAVAGELDRIDELEELYRLDASETRPEGMPSEDEPTGMTSEDQPAGMPSEDHAGRDAVGGSAGRDAVGAISRPGCRRRISPRECRRSYKAAGACGCRAVLVSARVVLVGYTAQAAEFG